MRTETLQKRLGNHGSLLVHQDKELKRYVSAGAVSALILSGWFSTFETFVDKIYFEKETIAPMSSVTIDIPEKKKPIDKKKIEEKLRKNPGSNAKAIPPKGVPQTRTTVALLHQIQAMSSKPNLTAYDMLGKTFTKDMAKLLENTNVLRRTGTAVFGAKRGTVNGSFDGSSIEGTSGGIDGMLSGLIGTGSPSLSTRSKSVPIPRLNDITMGDGNNGRSVSEVMAVVRSRTPGLRHIFNKFLKTSPGMAGKVTLRFTISPSGDVIAMTIAGTTTGNDGFDQEISRTVQSWRWKAIKAGNTTVTIPFTFSE